MREKIFKKIECCLNKKCRGNIEEVKEDVICVKCGKVYTADDINKIKQ